jgi:SGNH domain (fused to AT3 domains)
VLAARNDQPIPNPLKPQALGLADHVAADLEGCEYAGLPDPMPLCPRGDEDGDRTLVLVGDSHARHWIPAVDEVARAHGFRAFYFVYPGCTPALVQPWSPTTDAPDTACTTFHEWSQEQIEELRPDLLLMSTDTQQSYVDEDGERVDDQDRIAALIEQGMVDRIESLRPLVGEVAIIADPPRLRFNPETMFARNATLSDGLSAPHRRSMVMRDAVRRAAERTGARHVETRQWFCAYGRCPVIVGDYITRRDRGHLTLEYSAALAAPLGRALGLGRDKR